MCRINEFLPLACGGRYVLTGGGLNVDIDPTTFFKRASMYSATGAAVVVAYHLATSPMQIAVCTTVAIIWVILKRFDCFDVLWVFMYNAIP